MEGILDDSVILFELPEHTFANEGPPEKLGDGRTVSTA